MSEVTAPVTAPSDPHAVAESVFAKLTATPAPSEEKDEADKPEATESEQETAAESEPEAEIAPSSEEEPESEEEAQPEEPEKPTKLDDDTSVEVQGEKVTLKELKRGFLRERDYTKKTQALAAKERELSQSIETERKQFKDYLTQVETFVEMIDPLSAYEKLDWMQLARDDQANGTNNYSLLKAQFDQLREGRVKTSEAKKLAQEKEQQERQTRMATWADEQRQIIGQRYPDVKDPVKARAIAKEMDEYAAGLGFSEQELLSNPWFRDARLFKALRDGSLYQKSEAAKKAVVTKRVDAPAKVIAPKAAKEANTSGNREKLALKRQARNATNPRDKAEALVKLLHRS